MMHGALQVLKLHYLKRGIVLMVPFVIMALVVVITVMIALILQRVGLDVSSPNWDESVKNNGAALWSFPGFFVYLGVQAISTTFPFGMALGTTRRAYALGSAMFFVIQSLYVSLLGLALFAIERVTNGWFVRGFVFDVHILGNGTIWKLLIMLFAISFFALSSGAVFGALFVRLGSKGPLILAVSLVLLLGIALLVFAPQLNDIAGATTIARAALVLTIAGAVATVGQYFGLRSATVR